MPVGKSFLKVALDEDPVDQPPELPIVFHLVPDERSPVMAEKGVFVNSRAIRAAALLVHKTVRRLPGGDFALPANRNGPKTKPIVDVHPRFQLDRPRRKNLRTHPRRREPLQVVGIGEEGKNLLQSLRPPNFLFQTASDGEQDAS